MKSTANVVFSVLAVAWCVHCCAATPDRCAARIEENRLRTIDSLEAWSSALRLQASLKSVRLTAWERLQQVCETTELIKLKGESEKPILCLAIRYPDASLGGGVVLCLGFTDKDDDVTEAELKVRQQSRDIHVRFSRPAPASAEERCNGQLPILKEWFIHAKSEKATAQTDQPMGRTARLGAQFWLLNCSYFARPRDWAQHSEAEIPQLGETGEAHMRLVDRQGRKSPWKKIVVLPELYDLAYALSGTITGVYYSTAGQVTSVESSYVLDIDIEQLVSKNVWMLHTGINMWCAFRTCQWLEGKKVPACYEFRLMSDPTPGLGGSNWVPFFGLNLPREKRDVFYFDPQTMDLFDSSKQVLDRFVIPPKGGERELRKVRFQDYVKELERNPLTREYINLIRSAEHMELH